jgi:hypothetical protein
MRKVWFFVEGDSEELFITNLIRKKFYRTFRLEKDLSRFIEVETGDSGANAVYCENCGSVDKIPHRINEMYYLIEKSKSNNVIVVCDVEKLKCHSRRKSLIETKFDECIDKRLIKYAFFNPMIEISYWECPRIIEKIIELEYKRKFKAEKIPDISLPADISHSQDELKKHFKKFNMKYRETSFAEQFFPRVDYENCPDNVLARIGQFLKS